MPSSIYSLLFVTIWFGIKKQNKQLLRSVFEMVCLLIFNYWLIV